MSGEGWGLRAPTPPGRGYAPLHPRERGTLHPVFVLRTRLSGGWGEARGGYFPCHRRGVRGAQRPRRLVPPWSAARLGEVRMTWGLRAPTPPRQGLRTPAPAGAWYAPPRARPADSPLWRVGRGARGGYFPYHRRGVRGAQRPRRLVPLCPAAT